MSIGKEFNATDSNGITKVGLFNNANNSTYILSQLDKDVCKVNKVCFHVLPSTTNLKARSAFLTLSNTSNPQVATTYISIFKTLEGDKVFINLLYVKDSIVQFESKTLLMKVTESFRWKKIEVDFTTLLLKVSLSDEPVCPLKSLCPSSPSTDFYENVEVYYVCLVNDKDIGLSELTDFYMTSVSF